jgi:hypothetical protein
MKIKEAVKILKEKGIKIRKLISSGYRLYNLYDKTEQEIIEQAKGILAEEERKEKMFYEQEGIKNMAITEHLEEESKANNFATEKGAEKNGE